MCGRIIQSGGPLRYAIVDGMNARDGRVHDYPPRWNATPGQECWSSAAITRPAKCHSTAAQGLTGAAASRSNAKCEAERDLPTFRDARLAVRRGATNIARAVVQPART
jgi:hypothetical protein